MSAQAAPKVYKRPAPGTPVTPQGGAQAVPAARSRFRRWRWTEFWLLLIPSILSIVGMLSVIVVHTEAVQWQWTDLWMSFLFIGLIYSTHLWLNFTRPGADQVLLPLIASITMLGLVMVQRLEPALVSNVSSGFKGIANKQVVWIAAGIVALVVTVSIVRDLNLLRKYKYTFALLGIALVAATLV